MKKQIVISVLVFLLVVGLASAETGTCNIIPLGCSNGFCEDISFFCNGEQCTYTSPLGTMPGVIEGTCGKEGTVFFDLMENCKDQTEENAHYFYGFDRVCNGNSPIYPLSADEDDNEICLNPRVIRRLYDNGDKRKDFICELEDSNTPYCVRILAADERAACHEPDDYETYCNYVHHTDFVWVGTATSGFCCGDDGGYYDGLNCPGEEQVTVGSGEFYWNISAVELLSDICDMEEPFITNLEVEFDLADAFNPLESEGNLPRADQLNLNSLVFLPEINSWDKCRIWKAETSVFVAIPRIVPLKINHSGPAELHILDESGNHVGNSPYRGIEGSSETLLNEAFFTQGRNQIILYVHNKGGKTKIAINLESGSLESSFHQEQTENTLYFSAELLGKDEPFTFFEVGGGAHVVADQDLQFKIFKSEEGQYSLSLYDPRDSGPPGLYCKLNGEDEFTRIPDDEFPHLMTQIYDCFVKQDEHFWKGIPNKTIVRKYVGHNLDEYMLEVHGERKADNTRYPWTDPGDVYDCDSHEGAFQHDDNWCVYSDLCPDKGRLQNHCVETPFSPYPIFNADAQYIMQNVFATDNTIHTHTQDAWSGETCEDAGSACPYSAGYDPQATFIPVERHFLVDEIKLSDGKKIIIDFEGDFCDAFEPINILQGENVIVDMACSSNDETFNPYEEDPWGYVYACANYDGDDVCDFEEEKQDVCEYMGGVYQGDADDDDASIFNLDTIYGGNDGCCGDDTAVFPNGDQGFINDNRDFFCYYENEIWLWLWTDTQGTDNTIYPLPNSTVSIRETDVVSNGYIWSYCAASGDHGMNDVAAIPEYNVTPEAENEFGFIKGEYQYWPDSNYDGFCDCDDNNDNVKDENMQGGEDWFDCSPEMTSGCTINPLEDKTWANISLGRNETNQNLIDLVATCNGATLPGVGCPGSAGSNNVGYVGYGGYQWNSDQDPDYPDDCIPEGEVENGCTNDFDDDGDGHVDCQDYDCFYSGFCDDVAQNFIPPVGESPNEFLCYEREDGDFFTECCLYGKECANAPPENENTIKFFNYLSTGSQTNILQSFDFQYNTDATPVAKLYKRISQQGHNLISFWPYNWQNYDYLSFNIIFDNNLTIALLLEDGTTTWPININDYSTNGIQTGKFNHIRIPVEIFNTNGVRVNKSIFNSVDGNEFELDIDTIMLEVDNEDNEVNSQNRICSGTGEWLDNFDPEDYNASDIYSYYGNKQACDSQNPPGYGGYGWTGQMCCGDDTTEFFTEYFDDYFANPNNHDNVEYYNDILAGCFAGNKIMSNQRVGDAFADESFNDLLFAEQHFYSCNDMDRTYDDLEIKNGPYSNGNGLVTPATSFEMKGVWYCSPNGNWLRINESSKIRILAAKFFDVATNNSWDNYTIFCDAKESSLNNYINLPNDLVDNFCVLKNEEYTIIGTATKNNSIKGVQDFIQILNEEVPFFGSDQNISIHICDQVRAENQTDFFIECNMTGVTNMTIFYNNRFDMIIFSMDNRTDLRDVFETTFWESFWNDFKTFFIELFGGETVTQIPLTEDEAIFDKLYIAKSNGKTVKAVFEEQDGTNYSSLAFKNFDIDITTGFDFSKSVDSYNQTNSTTWQNFTFTNPKQYLWTQLTSSLRLN